MTTKVCSKCNLEKEIDNFHKRKDASDGYRGVCNSCRTNKPRKRKEKHCLSCQINLGAETLKKLCDSCRIKNKTEIIERANKSKNIKIEKEYRENIEKEKQLLFSLDNENELWKDIPGFDGKYQASSLGNIRCVPHVFRKEDNRLTQSSFYYVTFKNSRGYLQATLRDFKSISYHKGVHRWVMYAFHGESDLQVDHINGIKDDNRLINLRYATPRENNNYRKDTNPEYFSSSLYGTYLQDNRWYSYIKIEGVDYYLGNYDKDIEAHNVYMKAWKDWDELGKLPEKYINPDKTSKYDRIDFHTVSGKWRVRNSFNIYIGIFESENLAKRVSDLVEFMIQRDIEITSALIKKIRIKYGKDNRFKNPVTDEDTGITYKSISAASKAKHISPKRLKKHLDGEIQPDLNFIYANTKI